MDLTVEPSRLSMTSRVVLGILLLANLVVAMYLYFGEPAGTETRERQADFPAGQTLTLISELDPAERIALATPENAAPEERPFSPQAEVTCQAWGPFANDEVLEPVRDLVLVADPAARVVSFEIQAAPDYLVYLDSDNNLDNARRILKELESQGIDAYVIAGGEYINSVSAGVFSNREGASGLVERLGNLGYSPELQALARSQQATYLLGRVPADFRAGEHGSEDCGMIAQLQEFL